VVGSGSLSDTPKSVIEMAASKQVRIHESGQAVAAIRLGIGLNDDGIVLNSDVDAWTDVKEPNLDDEKSFLRRVRSFVEASVTHAVAVQSPGGRPMNYSPSGQNWTARTGIVLPQYGHGN
jgi:hypothetical protein